MAYYLGRDVKVYITTESTEAQVDVTNNTVTTTGGGAAVDVAATATVTIGGYTAVGRVITIIDAAATSITYTSASSEDFSENEFKGNAPGNSADVAASLGNAINNADGHNGTIVATLVGSVLTLTQATTGPAGNTTITSTLAATTKTNFTGGYNEPDFSGTTFAENLDILPVLTKIADLTGVDLGIGVTDEDITFMGSRTVLKAEIKKETTISLTRKKTDNVWDVVYNGPTASSKGWSGSVAEDGDYGARWGIIEGAADTWYVNNGLMAPKDVKDYGHATNSSFGYRVHIELKNAEQVISIPGCQLTGHTISLNADGTTEETCELISHVTPIIGTALDATNLGRMEITDL